jgi:hypothetical protein
MTAGKRWILIQNITFSLAKARDAPLLPALF